MNCFGLLEIDSGQSRVPKPPDRITGVIEGLGVPNVWQRARRKPVAIPSEILAKTFLVELFAEERDRTGLAGPVPTVQYSIAGIGAGFSSFGSSATSASVVISSEATEAASCSAVRTTLAGSITPDFTRSSYWPLAALKPQL